MPEIRVLLVDDDEDFSGILAKRLGTRGFKVTTASNGDTAIEKLKAEDYDVIVLDVFMPGKSGIETLQEAKPIRPLAEVIMLSGQATLEAAIEGMQHGAFDFLVKPASLPDLVDKLNKAYARKVDHEQRIRKADLIKAQLTQSPEDNGGPPKTADEPQEDTGRLLVIGRESDFSPELIEYALKISKRMSYAILAMSTANFDNDSFKNFPAARDQVCDEFKQISEKNAEVFKKAAEDAGIRFSHTVKYFGQDDTAIHEVMNEIGTVDYVVAESEDGLQKGQIVAYCPV